jgi:transcriptional regulator with XRE-family HTH domain
MPLKERKMNHALWAAVREWKSFAELSFRTGINPGSLSQIANGYRDPTPEQQRKICSVLGKSAAELGFTG